MLLSKLKISFFVALFFIFLSSSVVFADCTVQGLKKYYTDDKEADGSPAPSSILNATISGSNSKSSATNPYSFTVPVGSTTVSAPIISGYDVGYTLCYNVTTCHGALPTKSQSVAVNCSSGFIDLWWHYTKTGDLDRNKVLNLLDIFQLIKIIFT